MKWYVEIAEYAGGDYWYDYPPFKFDTEKEARDFAALVGGKAKVRQVYSKQQ